MLIEAVQIAPSSRRFRPRTTPLLSDLTQPEARDDAPARIQGLLLRPWWRENGWRLEEILILHHAARLKGHRPSTSAAGTWLYT